MPDGTEVLFSTGFMGSGGLWRMSVLLEQPPRRLPLAADNAHMPVVRPLRPGGPSRLVYARAVTDDNIWQIRIPAPGAPSSSSPSVLISSTHLDVLGDLSPDGSRVAFVSSRGGGAALWVANLDGSDARELLSSRDRRLGAPRWSPDGTMLAFHWNVVGSYDIYVIAAEGGEPRRLTSESTNEHVPSFSRDGRWIYFASLRTGRYEVWKVPVSGGDQVQVTTNGGFVAFETVDGTELYYTTVPGGGPSTIWRAPVAGGEAIPVIEGVISNAFAVLKRGVYYVDKPSTGPRLRFFDLKTARSTTIADDLGDVRPLVTASHDGRHVLYTRLDHAGEDLMIVEDFR
jgi:dipeptidyl aminopeptidase/acylaminoacyl peptidase